jgi:hypothetical protein
MVRTSFLASDSEAILVCGSDGAGASWLKGGSTFVSPAPSGSSDAVVAACERSAGAPFKGDSASFSSYIICSLKKPSVTASKQVSIRGKGLIKSFELRSR